MKALKNLKTIFSKSAKNKQEEEMRNSFVQGFYVIGPDLDSESKNPKTLFAFPDSAPDQELIDACFPTEEVFKTKLNDPEKFRQHVISDPIQRDIHYFIAYTQHPNFAPYYFCAKFQANLFNMPTFAHNLNFEDIFRRSPIDSLPSFEICLAVRTSHPYYDLYFGVLEWIIRSEQFTRTNISDFVDSYIAFKDYDKALEDQKSKNAEFEKSMKWPNKTREIMKKIINDEMKKVFRGSSTEFTIKIGSFPEYTWRRTIQERDDYQLTLFAMSPIWTCFSIGDFLTYLSAILLEKSIIIYSPDPTFSSFLVVASTLMFNPLHVTLPIITALPRSRKSALFDGKPKIVGIVEPLDEAEIPPNVVYINANNNDSNITITYEDSIPALPRADAMTEYLENGSWYNYDEKSNVVCAQILDTVSMFLKGLLMPIEDSFRPGPDGALAFQPELYISFFLDDGQPFAEEFLKTNMLEPFIKRTLVQLRNQ